MARASQREMPPSGESRTLTFTTPGLYSYYCCMHSDVDPALSRSVAHKDASDYPLPMEGFVLVSD